LLATLASKVIRNVVVLRVHLADSWLDVLLVFAQWRGPNWPKTPFSNLGHRVYFFAAAGFFTRPTVVLGLFGLQHFGLPKFQFLQKPLFVAGLFQSLKKYKCIQM
jgi:hypothetical protein